MEAEIAATSQTALADIFSTSSPSQPEAVAPSPAKVETEKKEDKPIEVKPEAAAEVKTEAAKDKPEEKPKVEAKAEEKPPDEKKEETPKVDYESDGNPYKKRYADTQAWQMRTNQEHTRQLEILNKKLDGTYDPAIDDKPKQTLDEAAVKGRIEASESAAYRIYGNGDDAKGKEIVEAGLAKFNDQFGRHQLVQMRVLNSPTPVIEAMKVMEEAEVIRELGPDPRQWKANLRKAILAEEEQKITERVTKDLMARVSKKETVAPSLTEVRGAGKETGEKPAFMPTSLKEIFAP